MFSRITGSDSTLATLAFGLQVVVIGLTVFGIYAGQYDLAINGILTLAVTLLPVVLTWQYDHDTDPRLVLWIALAGALHLVGFLGPYGVESGPLTLYDQLAHAVSASLVAGVGYALVAALDRDSSRLRFPDEVRVLLVLLFIMAFGVTWEIFEFASGTIAATLLGKEVLVQYGISDIVYDLLFNTLAAAVVAIWGTGYFSGLASLFTQVLSGP
jgi:uncharacterized membrane protein